MASAGIGPRFPQLRLVRVGTTAKPEYENAIFPDAKNLRESVLSSYQCILSTRKGERVMQPEFGLDARLLEFEAADEGTALLGTEMIKEALSEETRATVKSVIPSIQANTNQVVWAITAELHSEIPETIYVQLTP